MAAISVNQGTQTVIQTQLVAGTETPVIRLDQGSGTNASQFSGTFLGGTINAGTISLNQVPIVIGTSYGTVGTAGASFWGTLVAASGAGTRQYVAGIQIVGVSGTVETVVTNIGIGGSTGAGVLVRGFIPPSGGIAQNFNPIQVSGTNGTLSYWLGGAGTVDITVQYWQGV